MEILAGAKINLGLDVVRRRSDGYHEVRMIMQTVSLFDRLEMRISGSGGIHLHISGADLPADDTNLVYRACDLLIKEFGISSGVEISLEKNIPMAAGLAGGSADAAAALKGMNVLFSLGLSPEQLAERGIMLGADVPYCLLGGTALAEGIGEVLTPLPDLPDCHILIAKPEDTVSTPWAYKSLCMDENGICHLKRNSSDAEDETGKEAGDICHPDISGMTKAVLEGSLDGVLQRIGNMLELSSIPAHPVIRTIKQQIRDTGADGVLMSGSGPSVFGIFKEEEAAQNAFRSLRDSGAVQNCFLTRPLGRKEW